MFPGLTSKISERAISLESTIKPKHDLIRVTSTATTTVLATIIPPYGGFSGVLFIANRSGAAITTVTTGNILTATTLANNVTTLFVYSMDEAKWIVGTTT